MKVANVAIIGTGYVGLSCGACLAHLGHQIVCVDNDLGKVEVLNSGIIPIVEARLPELVAEGMSTGRLSFTTDLIGSVAAAEFVMLCLPTPQGVDGSADLTYLHDAVEALKDSLASGSIVITKSTVPIGTYADLVRRIGRVDIDVASNPEFVREGSAVADFLQPDRIVVGASTDAVAQRVAALYKNIEAPIVMTDPASAETLKYAANGFLALKLTYINSIAAICDAYGADIRDVVKGLSFDPRIGGQFFNPGPGWGGSCFPKDTRALTHIASEGGYEFALLKTAIEVNDLHQQSVADKVIAICDGDVRGKVIAAWGLTFKANTDDIRDSPAIVVVKKLLELGARMQCFDPTVSKVPTEIEGSLLAATALEATTGASALILLTEWAEFASVKPGDVLERMSSPRVVDARNLLDRESWQEHGFTYRGIGR